MEKSEFLDRDISWLHFNARVLQEARDPSNPLYERLRFLAIYSSNLAQFFSVRVSHHRNLLGLEKKQVKEIVPDTRKTLEKILEIVVEQQAEVSRIFEEYIFPSLKKEHIRVLRHSDLSKAQKNETEEFFHHYLLPYAQPVLLAKKKVRPFLNNAELYLAVDMREKSHSDSQRKHKTRYALVKVPSDHLPRFVSLGPSGENIREIILLDDIVRQSIPWLFPGFTIKGTYSIKLTRDSEIYIDNEFTGDLLKKIRTGLSRRNIGPAARLVYDRAMPKRLLHYLQAVFDLKDLDLLPEGTFHNNFDFFKFPDFGEHHLKLPSLTPLSSHSFGPTADFFSNIREKDQLLAFPYYSYDPVIRFFEKAAEDPDVTHIRIIQYRVAEDSRIMHTLIKAARNGKKVIAFMEIKARFDEDRNLNWGRRLEQEGVTVFYSFPGLKVHSKAALVQRRESEGSRLYTYLSTGNFNEETAAEYSDLGLFTSHPDLCEEVSALFSLLENRELPSHTFRHLLVGRYNLREGLTHLIGKEIREAQKGNRAEILIKVNNLQDPEMIRLLYKASQAGVRIRLIVRGICCLVPGVRGQSENIEAISIVARFLEHARIFKFHNGGDPGIYFSTADWMTRNLDYRIETVVPVYDSCVFAKIDKILQLQWSDNVKARKIDETGSNMYLRDRSALRIHSQLEIYEYFKKLEEELLRQTVVNDKYA